MLNRIFSASILVTLFAVLISVTPLNAQEMDHSEMMKKHPAIDVNKSDANMDGKVHVCSMGCAVSDEAGRCPKCEMQMSEMSVADAESLLKEKGFEVADHSKMNKGCGADCKKACCSKKETKEAKTCAAGCEKECCAKKEVSQASKCGSSCSKSSVSVADAKTFNKVCPMSGGSVDASVQTVSYNGKNYGFCGSTCVAHFKANPAKYAKNISECGKEFVASSM